MAKPKIDGTHKPINNAPCSSPLNHMSSENMRQEKARNSIMTSVLLSFLNIVLVCLCESI